MTIERKPSSDASYTVQLLKRSIHLEATLAWIETETHLSRISPMGNFSFNSESKSKSWEDSPTKT